MAKSKSEEKPQGFGLLEAARGMGWNRQEKWVERLPPDLRKEVNDTITTLANEPIGSVGFNALARVLMVELDRLGVEHPKEQSISRYFSDAITKLRKANGHQKPQ